MIAMINKSVARIAVILLLISLAAIEVKITDANPVPYDSSGTSNVEVSIISPQNKTYASNNIELIVNFGAYPGVWYIGYSLDGGTYIEIAPGHPLAHNLTETLSLSQLPKGKHSIEVKATAMANDEDGTVIACSKVYFTITKILEPLVSSSPTLTPTPTPTIGLLTLTPTPNEPGSNDSISSPTSALIIAVIVVACVCLIAGLLLKRNHLVKR
jgi:hypothetical protein